MRITKATSANSETLANHSPINQANFTAILEVFTSDTLLMDPFCL